MNSQHYYPMFLPVCKLIHEVVSAPFSFLPDIQISIVTVPRGVDINNQIFYNTQGSHCHGTCVVKPTLLMPVEKFSCIISVCSITALFTSL